MEAPYSFSSTLSGGINDSVVKVVIVPSSSSTLSVSTNDAVVKVAPISGAVLEKEASIL